jgi:hypothetical protein
VKEPERERGKMAKNMPLIERFFQKVDKSGSDKYPDCWIWKGGRTSKDYGSFKYYQETSAIGAHVSSHLFHIGEVPKGMLVCHRCDNPPCVNPEHLFLDTHSGNMKDMVKKGRNGSTSKRQTHCRRGHELDVVGVRIQNRKNGKIDRSCRECIKITARVRRNK